MNFSEILKLQSQCPLLEQGSKSLKYIDIEFCRLKNLNYFKNTVEIYILSKNYRKTERNARLNVLHTHYNNTKKYRKIPWGSFLRTPFLLCHKLSCMLSFFTSELQEITIHSLDFAQILIFYTNLHILGRKCMQTTHLAYSITNMIDMNLYIIFECRNVLLVKL